MPSREHDPVDRLNTHHADDLLAVARAFGGRPEAIAARALTVDQTGIRLAVDTPSGPGEATIVFAEAMPDFGGTSSMRMTFRELARRARRPG